MTLKNITKNFNKISIICVLFFIINIPFVLADNCSETYSNYECMNISEGKNCKEGLCPGNNNIQCCEKKTGAGFLPADKSRYDTGDYSLNDIVSVIIIISKWLLGIVGSLTLLMFIYGGIVFLISTGNAEQVKKGQQIILGAIIGLILVFASYTIINLIFSTLGISETWSNSNWFDK